MCRRVWEMYVQCGSGWVGRCGECVWSVDVGGSDGGGNVCGVWMLVGRTVWGMCVQWWKWVGRTVWGMCVEWWKWVGRCGECVWSGGSGSDGVGNVCGVVEVGRTVWGMCVEWWKWVGGVGNVCGVVEVVGRCGEVCGWGSLSEVWEMGGGEVCRRVWGMCVEWWKSVGGCGECVWSGGSGSEGVGNVCGSGGSGSEGVGNVCGVCVEVGRRVWGMCGECVWKWVGGCGGMCGECVWKLGRRVGECGSVGSWWSGDVGVGWEWQFSLEVA
ncbi:hypothetical protein HNY73_008337 [Argiope bruennichi]|uniref:Uncharacterized protein n=1 Tax=Argiope bruennichi TaxID=94029 RepID=A0A8T0FBB6_ARGBR|nr:hypothetical protein HNY73_008337 [Argiope bruennichi]